MIEGRPYYLRLVSSPEELAREAGAEFVRLAADTLEGKQNFSVALAGGSTPQRMYRLLAEDERYRDSVAWDRAEFFWGDERHVPPDHPDSNYRMAFDTLLRHIRVSPAQVHRIEAENPDASMAAKAYEDLLVRHFRLSPGEWPQLDLALLGLGGDGHTASLFPGTDVLEDRQHLVAAPWVEKFHSFRLTLTANVFNRARHVIFLVSGKDKATALKAVLQGKDQPQLFPAQLIRPASGALWLCDRDAASLLVEPYFQGQ